VVGESGGKVIENRGEGIGMGEQRQGQRNHAVVIGVGEPWVRDRWRNQGGRERGGWARGAGKGVGGPGGQGRQGRVGHPGGHQGWESGREQERETP
jgi:hypothetical protein